MAGCRLAVSVESLECAVKQREAEGETDLTGAPHRRDGGGRAEGTHPPNHRPAIWPPF